MSESQSLAADTLIDAILRSSAESTLLSAVEIARILELKSTRRVRRPRRAQASSTADEDGRSYRGIRSRSAFTIFLADRFLERGSAVEGFCTTRCGRGGPDPRSWPPPVGCGRERHDFGCCAARGCGALANRSRRSPVRKVFTSASGGFEPCSVTIQSVPQSAGVVGGSET